jgi:hypothetical protein
LAQKKRSKEVKMRGADCADTNFLLEVTIRWKYIIARNFFLQR